VHITSRYAAFTFSPKTFDVAAFLSESLSFSYEHFFVSGSVNDASCEVSVWSQKLLGTLLAFVLRSPTFTEIYLCAVLQGSYASTKPLPMLLPSSR
jgi:hypothetical protein